VKEWIERKKHTNLIWHEFSIARAKSPIVWGRGSSFSFEEWMWWDKVKGKDPYSQIENNRKKNQTQKRNNL
jgi:hypothetical protein